MEKFPVLSYATIEAYRVNGATPSLVPPRAVNSWNLGRKLRRHLDLYVMSHICLGIFYITQASHFT